MVDKFTELPDLIDRNKVLETVFNIMTDDKVVHKHRALNRNIKQIPKADTDRVAHWIVKKNAIEEFYCYVDGYSCSNCFRMTDKEYDFCPHCGYEMKEVIE